MAPDLPTEIWLRIASYLHKFQLLQLKSLNTFFFYCGMDIDWRRVKIDMRYAHRAVRVLSRMEDPFVASRTRRLTVCIRKPMLKEETCTPSAVQATLVTQLLNILPLLHNLTFFKLEILHISLDLQAQVLPALCQTITTSPLTRTIEELSLSGHPDMLASLVDSYPTFNANLSALHIKLTDYEPMYDANDNPPWFTVNTPNNILSLARFIISFSPSLQLLRIRISSEEFDVSPLFSLFSQPLPDSSSLIPLPNLKSLFLIIPFDESFKSSPQSIHYFLLVHSTNIQHLQLGLVVNSWRLEYDLDAEGPLGRWLSDFVNDISHDSINGSTKPSHFFPNLQTLDIFSPESPAGLSAVLTFVKRTAPTLSSLIIRRDLSYEEAKQVVYALTEGEIESSKLKSLRMNISNLDVTFVELLAYKLPQLLKLHLCVRDFSDLAQKVFVMLLEDRRDVVSIEDDCLATWKLHDLSIVRQGFGSDLNDAVAAVASVVPSIVLGGEDDEPSDED